MSAQARARTHSGVRYNPHKTGCSSTQSLLKYPEYPYSPAHTHSGVRQSSMHFDAVTARLQPAHSHAFSPESSCACNIVPLCDDVRVCALLRLCACRITSAAQNALTHSLSSTCSTSEAAY